METRAKSKECEQKKIVLKLKKTNKGGKSNSAKHTNQDLP